MEQQSEDEAAAQRARAGWQASLAHCQRQAQRWCASGTWWFVVLLLVAVVGSSDCNGGKGNSEADFLQQQSGIATRRKRDHNTHRARKHSAEGYLIALQVVQAKKGACSNGTSCSSPATQQHQKIGLQRADRSRRKGFEQRLIQVALLVDLIRACGPTM